MPEKVLFTLPSPLPPRVDKDGLPKKEVSAGTFKLYKARLNVLARAGWKTQQALIENAPAVVAHIKSICPDTKKSYKQDRRGYLSAIFFIMPPSYLATTNPFHQAFNEAKDPRPEFEFVEDD